MASINDSNDRKRGFAKLSPEERRRIARLGGIAAHAQGKAHTWTSEEAAAAGRKGRSKCMDCGQSYKDHKNVRHVFRVAGDA